MDASVNGNEWRVGGGREGVRQVGAVMDVTTAGQAENDEPAVGCEGVAVGPWLADHHQQGRRVGRRPVEL